MHAGAPASGRRAGPGQDYPAGRQAARPGEDLPPGKHLDEITLDAAMKGEMKADELRITPETLELQAQIAEKMGRPQMARNLRRAGELTRVSDERVLADLQRAAPVPLDQGRAAGHRRRAGKQVRRQDQRGLRARGVRRLRTPRPPAPGLNPSRHPLASGIGGRGWGAAGVLDTSCA